MKCPDCGSDLKVLGYDERSRVIVACKNPDCDRGAWVERETR